MRATATYVKSHSQGEELVVRQRQHAHDDINEDELEESSDSTATAINKPWLLKKKPLLLLEHPHYRHHHHLQLQQQAENPIIAYIKKSPLLSKNLRGLSLMSSSSTTRGATSKNNMQKRKNQQQDEALLPLLYTDDDAHSVHHHVLLLREHHVSLEHLNPQHECVTRNRPSRRLVTIYII